MKKMLFLLLIIPLLPGFSSAVSADEISPSEIQEEMIYNIFVDRYNNGDPNNDEQVRLDDPLAYQGGDLEGITAKLDDIKELGFTAISLSPIMENAPDGFHGYWVEDLFKVDEGFGTLEELKTLVKEAHNRDIKVILEFVTNYIAPTNPIATDPEKADWVKRKGVNSSQWLENVFVLNQENPEVKQYLFDAADFWIKETDIDGFKLHAADETDKTFLQEFSERIKEENPDFYLIAGMLKTQQDVLEFPETIDIVENTSLNEAMAALFSETGNPVSELYQTWEQNGKRIGLSYLDNEYSERFTRKVAENRQNPLTSWKLALTYLYTTPGVPYVYQGSEVPMDGGEYPDNLKMVQFNSGDQEIRDYLKKIGTLRLHFPALSYGDFELVDSDGAMSLFKRTYNNETIYLAFNNDTVSRAVSITGIEEGKKLKGLLGDNTVRENKNGEFKIGIDRESAEIYTIEDDTGLNWTFIGMILGIMALFIFAVVYLGRKGAKDENE